MHLLKIYYILLITLLHAGTTQASKENPNQPIIDHIEQELSILEDRTTTMSTHRMIQKAEQALHLADSIQYQRGIIKGHYVLALAHYYANDYKQALSHYDTISTLKDVHLYPHYISLMHKDRAEIYNHAGLIEWSKQEYKRGIKSAFNIQNLNYRHLILSLMYAQMSGLYYHPGDPQQMDTLHYYINKTEDILNRVSPEFIFPIAPVYLILKSDHYIHRDQLDSAQQCVHKLLEQAQRYKNADYPSIYLAVGNYHLAAQQPDSAHYYYHYALQRSRESGAIKDLPNIYESLVVYFAHQQQPDSVLYYENLYQDAKAQQAQYLLNSSQQLVNSLFKSNNSQPRNPVKRTTVTAIIALFIILLVLLTLLYINHFKKTKAETKKRIDQLTHKLNNSLADLLHLAKTNDPTFITHFQHIYPHFWDNLYAAHPDLSAAELHLCAMTYLNFTTQEIADYSFLQVRSVQTRRSRLRKKINLDPKTDLYHYLQSFDREI